VSALLFGLPDQHAAAGAFAVAARLQPGVADIRNFPDGETYVRVLTACAGEDAVIYAALDRPDRKLATLLLLAATLRDLGARRVGLVAPYLPYLRQDRRFNPGEGVTSRYFAAVISAHFDFVVTMDPHLHRYPSLDAVYTVPTRVVRADALLARWIEAHVPSPLLIGPDAESEARVAAIAAALQAPYFVLDKVRRGDRQVEVKIPDGALARGRSPVLVDDVVSTGGTLTAAAQALQAHGAPPPVCVAVHGLFCGDAEEVLRLAGISRIATVNTVSHSTNAMDGNPLLAEALAAAMSAAVRPAERAPRRAARA